MPAEFRHVWKDAGATDFSVIPRAIIVPIHRYTLLVLRGAKRWTAGPNLFVKRVEEKDLMDVLSDYMITRLEVKGPNANSLFADLWTLLKKAYTAGDSLLLVRGKLPGASWIAADGVKQELRLTEGESYDVSFKFLMHKGDDGQPAPATKWKPDDVKDWISELNWILGAQINIWFETLDAKWIQVEHHLDGVTSEYYKDHIVEKWEPSADVTVFLVGNWVRSGGTFHPDLHGTIALKDKPHTPVTKGNDSFIISLAHELMHFAVSKRGTPRGHVTENYVLLNRLTESMVIGIELYDWLFLSGKK